jgi:hypothetical protein
MNAPRRKQVVALPDAHELGGFGGLVKKHVNNALTVLLVIAAIAMFVRWRMRSAEIAKLTVANELVNARSQIDQLRQIQLAFMPPLDLIHNVQSIESTANAAISNVLNSSDADAHLRASALVLRGDLYWDLANLPPLPGSTTQPSLALTDSNDTLLQKSWDSYEEVLKNSTYADQYEQLGSAHLGVAAIAENRGDWAAAQKELETVTGDPNSPAALISVAKVQLLQLPEIQKKMFIAPPTGIGPVTIAPASAGGGPIGSAAPVSPPTTQFVLPDLTSPVKASTTIPVK